MQKNYYLHKNNKTGETLYLEYDKIEGYPITPKTKIEDAINVNKIIFVNPTLQEKIIHKKVEIKLRYFLKILESIDEDPNSDPNAIQRTIMEAEKLRVNILNRYIHYLGNTYGSYSLKKIQIIINQLRIKLYNSIQNQNMRKNYQEQILKRDQELYYLDEEEPKKGRGR